MSRAQASKAEAVRDRDEALELYRRMLLIRRFEDTVQDLFLKGEVHGTTHLYSGRSKSSRLRTGRSPRFAPPRAT
ncbi:MAG: hypothetical protein E6G38_10775 [Actinobacteria bacterium]|nr:MAG: hypothetical protein E6G38_10775 [Actinomycetota bacterium]